MTVYNNTDKSNAELISTQQAVISQIQSMQLMAVKEKDAVNNNIGANPDRLPVTVEIVYIGSEITYIYRTTEGEDVIVCLLDSNIETIPNAESEEPALNENNALINNNVDTKADLFAGTRGVPGLCSGPCTITANNNIVDGLGVRLPMTKSGVKLNFSVVTSGTSTIPPKNSSGAIISGGANYLYAGFDTTNRKQKNQAALFGFRLLAAHIG